MFSKLGVHVVVDYADTVLVQWLTTWTLGWVNLYQKFENEKNTVCGKLILPKNGKAFTKKNILFFCATGLRICMDLRIFASFLYPTLLKICTKKFDRNQFYSSTLNFVLGQITLYPSLYYNNNGPHWGLYCFYDYFFTFFYTRRYRYESR